MMARQKLGRNLSITAWALLLPLLCAAQRPRPGMGNGTPQPSGTVTGHVFCADTQRPARFAEVQLVEIQQGDTGERRFNQMVNGRTALDGSFILPSVPAGDYYAFARLAGYVEPNIGGDDLASQGLATVHVDVGRMSQVEVSIRRGATITGHILYDDGTPVPGVQVTVRSPTAGAPGGPRSIVLGMGRISITDDRGAYRLVGIAPGQYTVMATVITGDSSGGRATGIVPRTGVRQIMEPINVYAPAAMRRRDARVVEIRSTEEVTDIDITVALIGLHSVHGSVLAQDDRHPLTQGFVTLTDTADSGFIRRVQLDASGTFEFAYVPAGTYTLSATGSDGGRPGDPASGKRYSNAQEGVTVTEHDVSADDLLLPAATGSGQGNSRAQ